MTFAQDVEEEEEIEEFSSGGVQEKENTEPVDFQLHGRGARFHWRGKHHASSDGRKRVFVQEPEQRLLKRVKETGTESEDEEVKMVRRHKDLGLARKEVQLIKAKLLQETRERLERRDVEKDVENLDEERNLEEERKPSELEVPPVEFYPPLAKGRKRKRREDEGELQEEQEEAGKENVLPAKTVNFRDGK